MITIVDYGMSNLASVQNMLRRLGVDCRITAEPEVVAAADKLILPGVGAFDAGRKNLDARGLSAALECSVRDRGVPILGICLGAQLLSKGSEEGTRPGFGWIDAATVAFDRSMLDAHLRVPNMGWSDLERVGTSKLFAYLPEDSRFYLVHSYHLVCSTRSDVIGRMRHGYAFDVAFEHENILGVQFHPEKSHRFGMLVLRNFADAY